MKKSKNIFIRKIRVLIHKLFKKPNVEVQKDFEVLKNFDFLKNIRKKDLKLFQKQIIKRKFKSGEIIFKENFPHAVLYLLYKGKVEIYLEQNGKKQILSYRKPYSEFGEVGLFIDSKRTASARCLQETEMFAISKSDFKSFINSYPMLGIKILYNLGVKLSSSLAESNKRLKEYHENKES